MHTTIHSRCTTCLTGAALHLAPSVHPAITVRYTPTVGETTLALRLSRELLDHLTPGCALCGSRTPVALEIRTYESPPPTALAAAGQESEPQ